MAGLMLALLASNSASAAEVGSRCEGGSLLIVGIEGMVFPLEYGPSSALPVGSPIAGIATSWSIGSKSTSTFAQRLKVLRVPHPGTVEVTAETAPQPLNSNGPFPIRIPVQAGDLFGLNSPNGGAVVCNTGNPSDVVGTTSSNVQPGQTKEYFPLTGYQLALAVTVEPDGDGDGYGDETQDACPQLAAFQAPCPAIELSASATAGRKAVIVKIGASSEGSVSVTGVAKLGKGKRAKLSAGPKTVYLGKPSTFKLRFSTKLKRRLQELDPKRKVTLKITASATNIAGQISTDTLKAKLKGQA
jgi:hypothetical protein